MYDYKIRRLVLCNSIVFLFFLFLVEIFLGKWRLLGTPVTKIPGAPFSRTINRDVSKIYGLEEPYYITNFRDKKGYRSTIDYKQNDIILTIGGSTTAQVLVDDKYTWQSIISNKLNNRFSVINGGVSGQSSLGHLYSIEQWHSKSLPIENIKFIVYYFGINDTKILNHIPSIKEYRSQTYANDRFWRIKSFLLRYSFFYANLQELRNIYFPPKLNKTDFFGYKEKNIRFKDIGKRVELKKIDFTNKLNYIKLIKKLSEKTNLLFPSAKVYWVQQPLPGCKFLSSTELLDRHLNDNRERCKDLAEVYLLQDRALSIGESTPKQNVIKMYLDNPLTDEGTHDVMHNNELGSVQIGNYLYEKIFKNL